MTFPTEAEISIQVGHRKVVRNHTGPMGLDNCSDMGLCLPESDNGIPCPHCEASEQHEF